MTEEVLDLEVLVCTHQRADLLRCLLDTLADARKPEGVQTGLLVVANACTDDTAQVVQEMAIEHLEPQGWRVRLIEEPRRGKSHALNTALGKIQGQLVAFVDDDHRVDVAFLERLIAVSRAWPDADFFCGRILPDWRGWEPSWVHDEGRWAIRPLPVPRQEWGDQGKWLLAGDRLPGGGNFIGRREAVLRNGPFRTDLGPTGHDLEGGEDGEWIYRAVAGGARLRYDPGIVQYHYVDPARLRLGYLIRKAYLRSRASMLLSSEAPPGVPRYLWRMLFEHLVGSFAGPDMRRRRYHLVRFAAAAGELSGILQRGHRRMGRERG